jgi:hypothetical protein
LVGWLSGFRAQTGSIAKATFVRRLGEAAATGEESSGRAAFVVGPCGPKHGYHHDTKIKPEATTAIIVFMMMGGKTPETC